MSLNSTFLFASLLLTSACGKSEPEPFKGPLTLKQLVTEDFGEKNASAVKLCDEPWDAALARLQSRLGPPTKVAGDKYTWAVHEAESCAITSFSRGECPPSWNKPGPRVGSGEGPNVFPKSDGSRYDDCVAVAEKRP